MPIVKYRESVWADEMKIEHRRLNFHSKSELVASYPSASTVIENIERL